MIDITAVTQLNDFLSQWIEGEGQPFIYMPRYNRSHAPFGQCTRCVDVSEKTITDRRCPDCFGTGFNGGYGAPITGINSTFQRCYGFTSTDKITTDIQRSGIQVVNQNQVLYIKMLQQPAWGDLIIRDRDNVRFKVGNEFDYWSFNGLSLGYVITVFQVQDDDPAYLVPVPSLVTMQGRTSNASLQMQIEQMYSLTMSITPST